MSNITSDTLLVGIDISDGNDDSVMTVARMMGNRVVNIKVIKGEIAEQIYHDLVYREEVGLAMAQAADDGVRDGINTVMESFDIPEDGEVAMKQIFEEVKDEFVQRR